MPLMLKSDKNLLNYILLINMASLGITILPFYVVLSKSIYGQSIVPDLTDQVIAILQAGGPGKVHQGKKL